MKIKEKQALEKKIQTKNWNISGAEETERKLQPEKGNRTS